MKDLLLNMINLAFDLESKGEKENAISMLKMVSNHVSIKLNELLQNQEDNGNINTDPLATIHVLNNFGELPQGQNDNSYTDMNTPGSHLSFSVNDVQFTMIQVVGGTYIMGAIEDDEDGLNASECQKPAHDETVGDFWIGETQVTQSLWKAVMGSNPSCFSSYFHKPSGNRPVENVSWDDCQLFVNKLNSLFSGQLPSGHRFRLPTEAEWEYAARGGNRSRHYKYSGSDDKNSVAMYRDECGNATYNVKSKKCNELGIYDMSGNVDEWCEDNWRENYYKTSYDTRLRVFRGGSWYYGPSLMSFRGKQSPDHTSNWLGLRLAL